MSKADQPMTVSEITIAIGATVATGDKYEFARIDISNKFTLPEPVEVGSKAYRLRHKEGVLAVDAMVDKAKAMLIQEAE